MDALNGDETPDWDNDRLHTAYWEAQSVLEHQIGILSDIDDKAMRTVRINVLLVGVLLSATQIPGSQLTVNAWIFWGGTFLILSLVVGIYTYSESYPNLGVGVNELRQLNSSTYEYESDWQRHIVDNYANWIEENEITNRVNAYLLLGTQVLMVIGLVFISIGVWKPIV